MGCGVITEAPILGRARPVFAGGKDRSRWAFLLAAHLSLEGNESESLGGSFGDIFIFLGNRDLSVSHVCSPMRRMQSFTFYPLTRSAGALPAGEPIQASSILFLAQERQGAVSCIQGNTNHLGTLGYEDSTRGVQTVAQLSLGELAEHLHPGVIYIGYTCYHRYMYHSFVET